MAAFLREIERLLFSRWCYCWPIMEAYPVFSAVVICVGLPLAYIFVGPLLSHAFAALGVLLWHR